MSCMSSVTCNAMPDKQTLIDSFYTLPVTDVDAAPSPSKPQASSKPSPAAGKYISE